MASNADKLAFEMIRSKAPADSINTMREIHEIASIALAANGPSRLADPQASLETVMVWMAKSAEVARNQKRIDSALLWEDALGHLKRLYDEKVAA